MSQPLKSILRDEQIETDTLRAVVGFEEEGVFQLRVPGERAYDLWQKFRGRVSDTGYWPVITVVSEPELLTSEAESCKKGSEERSPVAAARKAILAQAQTLTFESWLEQQRDPVFQLNEHTRKADRIEEFGGQSMAKLYREIAEQYRNAPPWRYDPAKYEWPQDPPDTPASGEWELLCELTDDLDRAFVAEAILLFVPTRLPWEVPAFLLFGGFNACPAPEVHVAALKSLHARYGADLVTMGSGTIEVIVARRPTSRDEALRLAVDLSTYAEAVLAGGGRPTEGEIAAYLMESNQWGFWWD